MNIETVRKEQHEAVDKFFDYLSYLELRIEECEEMLRMACELYPDLESRLIPIDIFYTAYHNKVLSHQLWSEMGNENWEGLAIF